MKVCYYEDKEIYENMQSIFLAGPTPRNKNIKGWREEAIKILDELKFNGIVYVPQSKFKNFGELVLSYQDTIEWEQNRLNQASCIVFWIPRNLENMPAFTTNIEFGMYYKRKNVFYGRPIDAPKCKYLDYIYFRDTKIKPFENLKNLLEKTIKSI